MFYGIICKKYFRVKKIKAYKNVIIMKKRIHYLFYLLLLSLPCTAKANDSLQIAPTYNSKEHQSFLDLVLDVKDETTWEQWELFCEIMSLTNDLEL